MAQTVLCIFMTYQGLGGQFLQIVCLSIIQKLYRVLASVNEFFVELKWKNPYKKSVITDKRTELFPGDGAD